jgi:hypothetical protein
MLAMLCKTAVARKVLAHAWRTGASLAAATYRIDAAAAFGASVEACLLVCDGGPGQVGSGGGCDVFDSLDATAPSATLGFRDGELIADVARYERWKHLASEPGESVAWRSGVKHDCAAVVELGADRRNGLGEVADLEDELVFPMLKSSDLIRGEGPSRFMVVTQRAIGEDTTHLARLPRAWRYLSRHRARFERRKSSIYRGRAPFAMFGIGGYTFAPWKVAIAGLAKQLAFRVVGPHGGKPVVLDDTCYLVACDGEAEARELCARLSSEPAREFYEAFVFWDAKRPITSDLLRRLDPRRL